MKGPCFEEAMEHLKRLGICEVSKNISADNLGRDIREIIIRPFRELGYDQSCQDDLSKIRSALSYGIESPQVENEEICAPRVSRYDTRRCSRKETQTGNNIEHSVVNEQLNTPPHTEWTESSLDICVAEKSNEGGLLTNGSAQEAFDPSFDASFDVGNYLNFRATPESSVFSQGIEEDGCETGDLSQFDVW